MTTIAASFIKYIVGPNAGSGTRSRSASTDVTRLVWDQCRSTAAAQRGRARADDVPRRQRLPRRCASGSSTSSRVRRPASRPRAATTCCSCSPARAACGSARPTTTPSSPRPASTSSRASRTRSSPTAARRSRCVAVEVPDPPSGVEVGERRVTLRLHDAEAQQATANREFRLVVTPEAGCPSVTQFVGYIPVGRRARSLPHLRRGAVHPERRRACCTSATRTSRSPRARASTSRRARALARELGQRADAGARRVPAGGLAVGGVLPGRDAGDVLGSPGDARHAKSASAARRQVVGPCHPRKRRRSGAWLSGPRVGPRKALR